MTRRAFPSAPPHGGELSAPRRLAPGVEDWLDLSTGINPHPYPASVPPDALVRLPQADALARLLEAARRAYSVPHGAAIVAAPGTEAIIRWLPHLLPARRVAIVGPTYAGHAAAWSTRAAVSVVPSLDPTADLNVVVNPNNPDGRVTPPRVLLAFAARGGAPALLVDEAFGDLAPALSVAGAPGVLVLKSFGKFYGLPGLRLGFLVGAPAVVEPLGAALGEWAVSGPALAVGAAALEDAAWAESTRQRLAAERARLDAVLAGAGLTVLGGTDLFRYVAHPAAARLHAALAREGVWTRAFDGVPDRLRIGLPGAGLARLGDALDRATLAVAEG
jgi:cobalamin biosynthetic protein CobC